MLSVIPGLFNTRMSSFMFKYRITCEYCEDMLRNGMALPELPTVKALER